MLLWCTQKLCPWLSWLCLIYFVSIFSSCEFFPFSPASSAPLSTHRGEYISRLHDEHLEIPPLKKSGFPIYPWKQKFIGNFPQITKEYFRCKGKNSNSDQLIEQAGGPFYLSDCGGIEQHSLPIRNDREFIYPILIELLNYVQAKTEKRVIITSGHRCPTHNRYNDPLPKSQYSKHMLGAEVSFYVQGMETQAESIIAVLQSYYNEMASYKELPDFLEFKRWEKKDCDVSTAPWYNKEIFIKLYQSHEGRDLDNDHPFPYIAVQVRYDQTRKERVSYSWEQAFHNYWRW